MRRAIRRATPSASVWCLALAACLTFGSLFTNSSSSANEAASFEALLKSGLKLLPTFTYDQDPEAVAQLEKAILQSANDPAKRALAEEGLLGALETSTRDGSEIICRLLRTVASDRSVPQLENLLVDSKLSHLARYVLERMESDAAGAAPASRGRPRGTAGKSSCRRVDAPNCSKKPQWPSPLSATAPCVSTG